MQLAQGLVAKAFLYTDRFGPALLIAWGSGAIAVIAGISASFVRDITTGPLLVCTADGKGVPMRGTGVPGCPGEGLGEKGVRAGTKKMALLGAVYTVERWVRTPQQVLEALFRDARPSPEPPPSRPKPRFKRVRACLQRDETDSTEPQTRALFSWMALEVAQRDAAGEKSVTLLMDGQESLWKAGWVFLPGEEVTETLDLLHALSYLWEAAHLFHPKASGWRN